MNNKTPQFNKALNQILENLEPHQKVCLECQQDFEIMAEDIEFYKKLQVPPPTLCWECRLQRRMSYRPNFAPTFYKKSCSAPEHTEKIISVFAEKNPVIVYDDKYYLSDQWEATKFATDFNSENNFFEQYKNFALTVPHQTLYKDPNSVNSAYVISGVEAKNCYFVSSPYLSENIYYGYLPVFSKDSVLINSCQGVEQCYDSANLQKCYQCISSVNSSDCLQSSFLYDCKNCQNCFMSNNLRNQSYVFRNQQLSKEDYRKKIAKINLGSREGYQELKKEFNDLIKKAIKKNVLNIKTEQVIGNDNINSHNGYYIFGLIGNSDNNRYAMSADSITDSLDVYGAVKSTELYNTATVIAGHKIVCSTIIRVGSNLEYCSECNNCENCFACFGLKNKKYHIFNKAYSEEEYYQKIDELKTKMLERGEYGEFFPLKDSPFPYQDSNAQVEFPLTEEEIKKKGWHWQDEVKSEIDLTKIKTIRGEDVSDNIKDIADDILKTPIICERTGKPFKILPYELEFYKKMNVPLPTIHSLERIKDLFQYRRSYKLFETVCAHCNKKIQTVHNPAETENIWCENCYNQEIN